MKARGFSLFECLIGLALSLFIVCACLEFFGAAQKSYFRLKDKEEAAQSALAAMDKMRVDILRAGQGLGLAVALGLVEPAAAADGSLAVTRSEKAYGLAADVGEGDSRIPLTSVSDLKPGRQIFVSNGENGEVRTISSVAAGAVIVSSPLDGVYARETTSVQLLETVILTMDQTQGVIRRRVNLSTAQPLLENARSADFLVDWPANLIRVRFTLISQGDASYELCLFPKNPALARKQ